MTQTKELQPPQKQTPPGREGEMTPKPQSQNVQYKGSSKLEGKVALITGGDSGIGRATAILFAREGADVAIVYLSEQQDAEETKRLVEAEGKGCLLIKGDVGSESFCKEAIQQTVNQLGHQSIEDISAEQLERTFRTNIFGMFFLTKAALPHLKEGSTIINTTSVTAYKGNPQLLDYSATKGAIVAFTRSLSQSLVEKGIRVNGVAPGPIWTPLIPSTFPEEKVKSFGAQVPMQRAGQPEEVAPCYVFLASQDSSYMSGQILHPNGGEVVNA
jgi:NAD(P)-dependent dehydrogenase (short-subunit alcohol dehydrogenase family)